MKKTTFTMAILTIYTSALFAGGDNRVTMTDMKEALYGVVLSTDKLQKEGLMTQDRVGKIETIVPDVERNTDVIRTMVTRLNELGIVTDVSKNNEVSGEIERFVDRNKHLLPQAARGVR